MITRGISVLSQGMQALLDYEDVTAHNLANVTTTGFKKSHITFQDTLRNQIEQKNLSGEVRKVGELSGGVRTDRTYIDFSQGTLQETGNKLDIGFSGDGFLKIRFKDIDDNAQYSEKDYYYQRIGDLKISVDNYLVNSEGDYVMDVENKRIRITRDPEALDLNEINRMDLTQDLVISENGRISLNSSDYQVNLQQIQVCDFDDKTKVSMIGLGKYLPIYGQDVNIRQLSEGQYSIQQGMLEMSNVNTITEMINTINVSRGYETMSKLLKSQSDTVNQAIGLGNISR